MDHSKYMHMHGGSMSSMKKASFEAALKSKKQIVEGTMAFTFEKPEGFTFKAGQHVRMTLINPSETDSEGNSRFLSVASTPQDTDLVFAMRMRDTAFKRALKQMPIGQKVLIQILLDVPHGAFALHPDTSKPAVFLIGGIGIVPAFSMIKDATERKLSHKTFLFYSNRRPEDAPFLEELQQLAKQNPNFILVATMTEPEKSSQAWKGETGFIDQAIIKKYVTDLQTPIYYVAGLLEMTSAMKQLLSELDVSKENIQAEEFSGFNLNEIQEDLPNRWKRHALVVATIFALVALAVGHVKAVSSISTSTLFSPKNPFLYVMAALMLVITVFKFKHLSKFVSYINT